MPLYELRLLEGQSVNVALLNGSRIDDRKLVSIGRKGTTAMWLSSNNTDVFVPVDEVADLWEAPA